VDFDQATVARHGEKADALMSNRSPPAGRQIFIPTLRTATDANVLILELKGCHPHAVVFDRNRAQVRGKPNRDQGCVRVIGVADQLLECADKSWVDARKLTNDVGSDPANLQGFKAERNLSPEHRLLQPQVLGIGEQRPQHSGQGCFCLPHLVRAWHYPVALAYQQLRGAYAHCHAKVPCTAFPVPRGDGGCG